MIKSTFSERKIISAVFIIVSIAFLGASFNAQASVANNPMRNLSRAQYVNDFYLGWNLGNTFDGSGTETGWGNPVTTQAMIDVVHKQGFKFMRLPVTWKGHFGAAPTYTIDASFLARVVAVANYALNDSMYVMVNTHHDGTTGGWYNLGATGAAVTSTSAEVAAIWTQIANAFKSYSDYMLFEIFNEPQNGAANQYGGGDATSRANLAAYQTAAVNAIRATGGNNATRMIVLQGISASPIAASVATIPMVDGNILVSLHTYDPVGFSMNGSPTTWGSASDTAAVMRNLTSEQGMVSTKGGVAIVGEWGSVSQDDLASRVHHAQFYARECRNHGMVAVWWDDGAGFHILNRKANPIAWQYPTIAQALADGAKAGVFPGNIPISVEPLKENKFSSNSGLLVKASVVNYTLPQATSVSLNLYNMQGKRVSTLVQSNQAAGNYEVKLPTKGISFGNYILEYKAGNNFITKRINIL
jgi:endoglucanase